MTEETGYDATLDPRTGRPILPLDAEKASRADFQDGEIEDEDVPEVEEDEDDDVEDEVEEGEEIPRPIFSRDEGSHSLSEEEIDSISPRMKGPGVESEDSDEDLIDRNI